MHISKKTIALLWLNNETSWKHESKLCWSFQYTVLLTTLVGFPTFIAISIHCVLLALVHNVSLLYVNVNIIEIMIYHDSVASPK